MVASAADFDLRAPSVANTMHARPKQSPGVRTGRWSRTPKPQDGGWHGCVIEEQLNADGAQRRVGESACRRIVANRSPLRLPMSIKSHGGRWSLESTTKIGTNVAANAIESAIGI